MSDSLLNALKVLVVVGAVALVGGTALLIWALVQRGASGDGSSAAPGDPPAAAATVDLPAGAEIRAATLAGSQLVLLGSLPDRGQFVLVVDAASGERRRFLRLVPEPR